MGLVLEAHGGADVHNLLPPLPHQRVGHFQPFADEPLLRREVAYLLEVALEGGQAPARVVRQFFLRQLVHVVLVHEVQDVNLPRLVEVEEGGCKAAVYVQQGQQALLHLQAHEVVLGLHLRVEEGGQRGEQAGYFRRPGQLDDARPQLGRMGRHPVGAALGIHLAQEAAGEAQEDAAVTLAPAGLLVQRDVVVAGDEDAFAFPHVDLLLAVVQDHLAGIHIVHGILARTVHAGGHVVIKETEKHILVVEDELQRAKGLFGQILLFHKGCCN